MAAAADLTFTVGDRLRPARAILENADGTPIDLTGNTVIFRMIAATGGAAKVADQPAVVESPATAGSVRYDWAAADVASADWSASELAAKKKSYYGWFQRATGGKTETLPPGRTYQIDFVLAS